MEIARHKWRSILPKLGIPESFLINRHGPCPLCGGKDRFRFDDKDGEGSWICNNCGAGDGFDLLTQVLRKPFREVSRSVYQEAIKMSAMPSKIIQKDETELRNRQKRLWLSSKEPEPYGPVNLYLMRRLKNRDFNCAAIREARLPDGRIAMVSKIATPEGRAANLHLTWIKQNGDRADVPVKKQLMAGSLPAGSAIRLMKETSVLGIAEGIETAISASIIHNMPVWSAINANNLVKWEPPPGVKDVWIFGDSDPNFVGQSSAYNLAQRLYKKGSNVVVSLPDWPHKDWNDALRGES